MALYSGATLSSRLRKNNFNLKVIQAHNEYSKDALGPRAGLSQ